MTWENDIDRAFTARLPLDVHRNAIDTALQAVRARIEAKGASATVTRIHGDFIELVVTFEDEELRSLFYAGIRVSAPSLLEDIASWLRRARER